MYGNIADADAYHASMGNTGWAALASEVKEALLTRASLILDGMFEAEFVGKRVDLAQPNAWPRSSDWLLAQGIGPTETPPVIEAATYELSWMVHQTPSLFSAVFAPGQMLKRKTIGPITKEYAVPTASASGFIGMPEIPLIRGWLSGLLRSADLPRNGAFPVMVI